MAMPYRKRGRKFLYRPKHPLAAGNGKVLEYRAVLYEAIGPGPHHCVWCGDPIEWEASRGHGVSWTALVVDHLDGDMHNNTRDNLAPSCNECNTLRGKVLDWEARRGIPIETMLRRP